METEKMISKSDITQKQTDWLNGIKELILMIVEQDMLIRKCCPLDMDINAKERSETLREIAQISKAVSQKVKVIRKLESSRLGITALLPKIFIDEETCIVLYCAFATRLDSRVAKEFRTVADYVTYIAARDPVKAVYIRSLFRYDSPVGKFFARRISEVVLDERCVYLREPFFNKAIGFGSDVTITQWVHRGRRWKSDIWKLPLFFIQQFKHMPVCNL